MDDFTRLRKKIAQDIRETKEVRFYSSETTHHRHFHRIFAPWMHSTIIRGGKVIFFVALHPWQFVLTRPRLL